MQETETSKNLPFAKRLGKTNLIWISVCCALMAAALAAGICLYKDLPTSEWRQSETPLPWKDEGICIDKAHARWQSSQGNPRMELRVLYYPLAHLELGQAQGSGTLLVRFTDSDGAVRGGSISLPYAHGSFIDPGESNVKIHGKSADVYAETGFISNEQLTLHNLSEGSALWRVSVWNRPAGVAEERFMGYSCLPPNPPQHEQRP